MAGKIHRRLQSLRETVELDGGTIWFWRTAIWNGLIPVVKIGRKQFLDSRDIDRFIEQHKHQELS